MTPAEKTDQMVADVAQRRTEGISVTVVGTDDLVLAAAVGPLLAAELFPHRTVRSVLHVEALDVGIEVVVEVL